MWLVFYIRTLKFPRKIQLKKLNLIKLLTTMDEKEKAVKVANQKFLKNILIGIMVILLIGGIMYLGFVLLVIWGTSGRIG
ncbi:hypothetical protein CLU81_0505 [Flavobacterium sp. 9]|nr:hypothetical protein CLU81_0505 [Flavobacterium sp. 9]